MRGPSIVPDEPDVNAGTVIFVNRFFYPDESATSQILSELAFALAAGGKRVAVVTSRQLLGNPTAGLPRKELIRGVHVIRAWSTRFGGHGLVGRTADYASFYLGAAVQIWRMADADTTVVAKTDPPLISLLVAPLAKWKRARLVNWLQDLFPEVASVLGVGGVRGPVLRVLQRVRNRSLLAAKTNVVLGSRMQSMVAAQGVPPDRIRIIHNWADGDHITPRAAANNPLRKTWGLQDKFVVGYSGNFGRAHEFETIVGAAEWLKEDERVVFLMIGGGAQRKHVEILTARRGLRNFQFRPYQPKSELSDSLGVADVHLVTLNPALEGLIVPSKFYGIAAAGRPTLFIGDTDGEIPRMLREHQCGAAVVTGDAAALAAHIQAFARESENRLTMGKNARAAFERLYERKLALNAWKDALR